MLNKHFREFIGLLKEKRVKFLVVGGYAVGVHGFPRYTGDLDIFVAADEANAEKIAGVFAEFGFAELGLRKSDFLKRDMIFEVGREPLKIQVLTGIDGVTFEECHQGRTYFTDGNLRIPLIGYEDLLKNKKATPRSKDKIDVIELQKIRAKKRTGQKPKTHSNPRFSKSPSSRPR